jgi:Glucosidase II beta subunit-like protein
MSSFCNSRKRKFIGMKLVMATSVLNWLLLLVLLIASKQDSFTVYGVSSSQYFTNLFSDHTAEYDPLILDPFHVYGSPYGGFSRANPSRLASLPFHLPDIIEDEGTHTTSAKMPLFFEIRDDSGRLYACRLYHEDELAPESFYDSMFDVPILRDPNVELEGKNNGGNSQEKVSIDFPQVGTSEIVESSDISSAISQDTSSQFESSPESSEETSEPAAVAPTERGSDRNTKENPVGETTQSRQSRTADTLNIQNRLKDLVSVCGQIHKGWWSYEWCFEESVTQFHIEYDIERNSIQVESVVDLGFHKSRSILLDVESLPPNEYAGDAPELARVVDVHDGGSTCDETGNTRRTFVNMVCCSEKVAKQKKGMLHKEGHPISTHIAALLDVEEDPDVVCSYNVTVCTPLLCGTIDTDLGTRKQGYRLLSPADESNIPKENESIREILDRVLSMLCLQTNNGGWWTYEICYKQSIRQFHESIGVIRSSVSARKAREVVESEHVLGVYDVSKEKFTIPDEEWRLVVNVTSHGVSSSGSGGGKSWGEGSGAYYEVEYIGGDVCDHTDVTDAAIVAGSTVGSIGGVERASSVRFFCGESYDVAVYEDSTCHYIVQVKVPALCQHRLFRAPSAKKQIIKCLPINE